MNEIKVAVIGSGGTASSRAVRFSETPGFRLAAIASRNPVTGRNLAAKHGVKFVNEWCEIVKSAEIDAVVICTHNDSHAEIARHALTNGKHVFMEYPLARRLFDGEEVIEIARRNNRVLRLTHREYVSPIHRKLRQVVSEYSPLRVATFTRLTPGRGARPEILFNLNISGPPALFFIYHVFPVVDLFGEISWVSAAADYENLSENGNYDSFVNVVSVGFQDGGLGQWLWAGGIGIERAEEYRRYVLSGATLIERDGRYYLSTRSGTDEVLPESTETLSLEELFLRDITGDEDGWIADAEAALRAIKVSLMAERSMMEHCRIDLIGT